MVALSAEQSFRSRRRSERLLRFLEAIARQTSELLAHLRADDGSVPQYIGKQELRNVAAFLRVQMSNEEVDEIFDAIDGTVDGGIDGKLRLREDVLALARSQNRRERFLPSAEQQLASAYDLRDEAATRHLAIDDARRPRNHATVGNPAMAKFEEMWRQRNASFLERVPRPPFGPHPLPYLLPRPHPHPSSPPASPSPSPPRSPERVFPQSLTFTVTQASVAPGELSRGPRRE